MKVGRNDPCPCGSGKKYKACCWKLDQASGASAAGLLPGAVRQAAREATSWETDLVPLPVIVEDDPASRPTARLVVAAGLVIGFEMLARPAAEAEAVATELAHALRQCGEEIGAFPQAVKVRFRELVEPLTAAVAELGIAVQHAPELPGLDEAADALLSSMAGRERRGRFSAPATWRGWGQSDEWIARVFRAAAGFYRAAPWRSLTNRDTLYLQTAAQRRWYAIVLGNDQQEYGLVLFTERRDLRAHFEGGGPEALPRYRGAVLFFSYDAGAQLPRAYRKEVAAAGWEVASAEAYPVLFAINTLAGGLTAPDAEDLARALEAVPRYLAASVGVKSWIDSETGVVVGEERIERKSRRAVAARQALRPGGPEGPKARPEGALEALRQCHEDPDRFVRRQRRIVTQFSAWLGKRGCRESAAARHASAAETFIDFLAGHQGVPWDAIHEFDLPAFLFDWYHRKVVDILPHARSLASSLRSFFAFLAENGVECPWAEPLFEERERFLARRKSFPGGFWWDEAVRAWQEEVWEEHDALLFLPDGGLFGGEQWGATMGAVEAELHQELQRRWLLWRDELLASGVTRRERLEAALITRQREWEKSPHPGLEGRSPVQAIEAERRNQR